MRILCRRKLEKIALTCIEIMKPHGDGHVRMDTVM